MPVKHKKANTEAILAALDSGLTPEDAIRAGYADEMALTVIGKAGLPLSARDAAWDAQAAKQSLSEDQYGDAFFYRDPDGDPAAVSSYKLGFAKNDNGLVAVWSGITAVAAVLQGGRGGVAIPADEQDAIKGKVNGYYAAAREKYDDDSITPPWEGGAEHVEHLAALARIQAMTRAEYAELVGAAIEVGDPADATIQALAAVAEQIVHCPDYGDAYWNADSGDVWWVACDGDPMPADPNDPTSEAGTSFDDITNMFMAVDGVQSVTIEAENLPVDDGSYVQVPEVEEAAEPADADDAPPVAARADADTFVPADEPHPFQPLSSADGACAVCGQMADDPIHEGYEDEEEPVAGEASAERVDAGGFLVVAPVGLEEEPLPVDETVVVNTEGGQPFKATLAVEGVATDDGRLIKKGALTWRELPLTLMAIIEDSHGGMPQSRTVVAGRIEQIERVDTGEETADIIGTGVFDTGEQGVEIARLVSEKMMRGVSIDMAPKVTEELWGDEAEGGVDDPFFGDTFLLVVVEGVILGATVCPFAAFGEADIETLPLTASGLLDSRVFQRMSLNERGHVTRITLLGMFQPQEGEDVPPPPTGDGTVFIGVFPSQDEALALADPDGNIPPDGLHVTLCAFAPETDVAALSQLVDEFAQGYGQLQGEVAGFGAFTAADEGDKPIVLLVDAPGLGDLRFALAEALEGAGISYLENHDFVPHITVDYDDPADMPHDAQLGGKPVTFTAISIVDADGNRVDVPLAQSVTASAAGLVPEKPPGEWFDYPTDQDDGGLIPFTVTPEGRVYGHVAVFNECHIGRRDRCVTAPHHYQAGEGKLCAICGEPERLLTHSRSGYDYFHLGQVETAEGDLVNVGQITVDTTHPAGTLSAKQATAHYDNTGAVVADLRLYENQAGVVCAGALRADAISAAVRKLRGSKPSGDWRTIRGRYELVGLLAANVPGYPVPRRTVKSDPEKDQQRELALVAAGVPDYSTVGVAECDDDYAAKTMELVASDRIMRLVREARR